MKAVILAGGMGTRLRPVTGDKPKPMVPLLGKPLMEHIIALLQAQGFDEFHCAEEFGNVTDNVWGCDDAVLFKHAEKNLKEEPKDAKVFHLILK